MLGRIIKVWSNYFVHCWKFVVAVAIAIRAVALPISFHFIYSFMRTFCRSQMEEFNGNAVFLFCLASLAQHSERKKFLQFTCIIISSTLEETMDMVVCMCIGACLLYMRLSFDESHNLSMLQTIVALLRFKKRTLDLKRSWKLTLIKSSFIRWMCWVYRVRCVWVRCLDLLRILARSLEHIRSALTLLDYIKIRLINERHTSVLSWERLWEWTLCVDSEFVYCAFYWIEFNKKFIRFMLTGWLGVNLNWYWLSKKFFVHEFYFMLGMVWVCLYLWWKYYKLCVFRFKRIRKKSCFPSFSVHSFSQQYESDRKKEF